MQETAPLYIRYAIEIGNSSNFNVISRQPLYFYLEGGAIQSHFCAIADGDFLLQLSALDVG